MRLLLSYFIEYRLYLLSLHHVWIYGSFKQRRRNKLKINAQIPHCLLVAMMSLCLTACFPSKHDTATLPELVPDTFLSEAAAVAGEIPAGWTQVQAQSQGVFLHHPAAPGHVLSIQKLTENVGSRPLKALRTAFKEHPYFSDFTYEKKWAEPIEQSWSPAYHASYIYLDAPAFRHGHLLPTQDGYYEVAYHAPVEIHPEGLIGYEHLLASISIIPHD